MPEITQTAAQDPRVELSRFEARLLIVRFS
jgi:hypothetical protein